MAGNCFRWIDMAGMAGNGRKWMECLDMAEMEGYGWNGWK